MEQHPFSVIDPSAKIGENVKIGPFVTIDGNVEIGDGTVIDSNVTIHSGARIGKNCHIHSGAVISDIPQDLKFKGEETLAIIGDGTSIREFVTIHRGTASKGKTVVGNNCLIMAYCHVAHDCILHDKIIMSNAVQLAGVNPYFKNIGGNFKMNMVYRAYRAPYEWVPQATHGEEVSIEPLDVETFRVPGASKGAGTGKVTVVAGVDPNRSSVTGMNGDDGDSDEERLDFCVASVKKGDLKEEK